MRPHAEVKADFEAGIPLDMDGERRHPRRTPEAQADITAARAAPNDMEIPMQDEESRAHEAESRNLDAALSNAAIADTPAVREMGGPAQNGAAWWSKQVTCEFCGLSHQAGAGHKCPDIDADTACQLFGLVKLPPDAVVLTGPEAASYRALQAAARKAQASATTARADGAALLQLFQAFCAGLAPGKDG